MFYYFGEFITVIQNSHTNMNYNTNNNDINNKHNNKNPRNQCSDERGPFATLVPTIQGIQSRYHRFRCKVHLRNRWYPGTTIYPGSNC